MKGAIPAGTGRLSKNNGRTDGRMHTRLGHAVLHSRDGGGGGGGAIRLVNNATPDAEINAQTAHGESSPRRGARPGG